MEIFGEVWGVVKSASHFELLLGSAMVLTLVALVIVGVRYLLRRQPYWQSKRRIQTVQYAALAILNGFDALFAKDEGRLLKNLWNNCDGNKTEKNRKFQELLRQIAKKTKELLSEHFQLQQKDDISVVEGQEKLEEIELEWVKFLVQILGAEALSWELPKLCEELNFSRGLSTELFERGLVTRIYEDSAYLHKWESIDPQIYQIDPTTTGVLGLVQELKAFFCERQKELAKIKEDYRALKDRVEDGETKLPEIPGLEKGQLSIALLEELDRINDFIFGSCWTKAQQKLKQTEFFLEGVVGFAAQLSVFGAEYLVSYQKAKQKIQQGYGFGMRLIEIPKDKQGRAVFMTVNNALIAIDLSEAQNILDKLKEGIQTVVGKLEKNSVLHQQSQVKLKGLHQTLASTAALCDSAKTAFDRLKTLPASNFSDLEQGFKKAASEFVMVETEAGDDRQVAFAGRIWSLEQESRIGFCERSLDFNELSQKIAQTAVLLGTYQKAFKEVIERDQLIDKLKQSLPESFSELNIQLGVVRDLQNYPDNAVQKQLATVQEKQVGCKAAFAKEEFLLTQQKLEEASKELQALRDLIFSQNKIIDTLEQKIEERDQDLRGLVVELDRRYAAVQQQAYSSELLELKRKFDKSCVIPVLKDAENGSSTTFDQQKGVLERYLQILLNILLKLNQGRFIQELERIEKRSA